MIAFHLRDPAQRRRRGGRVGDTNASPGRLSGVQEVFTDEIADEEGGTGQNQSPGQRNVRRLGTLRFWRRGF
jgi:hypothetical protein